MTTEILIGDSIELLAELQPNSVDAIVCDPPYGLEFMGKDWDSFRSDDREVKGYNGRVSGVSGQATTDGKSHSCPEGTNWRTEIVDPYAAPPTMLAFQNWVREWAIAAFPALKPGGHILAFGSPRTYHRLTSGLEDAGFEIRDTIAWLHGQGFPKSHDIGKAIDRRPGVQQRDFDPVTLDVTLPATEQAREWTGWGTALKPAFEPIVMARKPIEQSVAANVLEHRTGGINIDGCRLPMSDDDRQAIDGMGGFGRSDGHVENNIYGKRGPADSAAHDLGRWPANVTIDGHVTSDLGPQARYFYCPKPSTLERGLGLDDRNPHPTVKPVELMRWCVRLVTPPGGRVLDPFLGSGTTAIAAYLEGMEFVGIDREEEYAEVARARVEWWREHADAGAPTEAVLAVAAKRDDDQLGLFGGQS